MFPWTQFFTDSAIYVAAFTAVVLVSFLWKPRLWLHDLPADIQAMAGPKTPLERRQTRLLGVVMIPVLLALPLLLASNLKASMGDSFSFFAAWVYGYGMFFAVMLWDLLALDFLSLALINPQHPPIPGTEGAAGWKDYAFHFRAFLKGGVMGLIYATAFAAFVSVMP
jgi:hypothetical protein